MIVVVADGSVVTASDHSHPDLFWGLRGAGSNFGVVTDFVFKLYLQPPTIFAGPLVFSPHNLGAVTEAALKLHELQATNASAALVFARRKDTNEVISL